MDTLKTFFGILTKLNPVKIFGKISVITNHAKLIGDTCDYYKSEGIKRGLLKSDPAEIKSENV